MSTNTLPPHLTVAADGTVHIGTTRYKVLHLATEHYHHGWSAEELLRQHPDLRPEQDYTALAYFYDHYDELVAEMQQAAATADQLRQPAPFSREELLRRRLKSES